MTAKVELVAVTYPKIAGVTNAEELVAYIARVSNPSNQLNMETSDKLIKYLIKHQHWSPFEMVNIVLEIETTRDIARQILRHRSFTFQEFSQRYANPVEELSLVTREARYQDQKNRQNSVQINMGDDHDRQLSYQWESLQDNLIERVEDVYKWAISKGIAKEQARAVLPEGLTKSRMYMNGSLRSWIHYTQLRRANGTQLEHQHIAQMCAEVLQQEFPNITAFVDNE